MIQKLSPVYKSGLRVLDEAHEKLRFPQLTQHGMDILMYGLRLKKQEWKKEEWRYFCDYLSVSHPVRKVVHQDPITFRSFSKPRGYAGDAVLLDYLYGEPAVNGSVKENTEIG